MFKLYNISSHTLDSLPEGNLHWALFLINFPFLIIAHQPQQDTDLEESMDYSTSHNSMAASEHHNFQAPLPVAQRMYPPGTFWHEPRAGCSKDLTQPTQPQPDARETADDDYMPDDNANDAIEAEDFLPSSVAQSLAEEELDREHIQGSHHPGSSARRKRRRKGFSNVSRHSREASAQRHRRQQNEARREAAAQQGSLLMPDPESREEEQEEESAPHGSRRETLAERREEQQDRIQARLKKKRTHNKALADLDTLDEGNLCLLYTSPSPRDS